MAQAQMKPRRMPRVPVHLPTTWSVRDGVDVLTDDGELRDVNASGAFLHLYCVTTHPLWPGTRVKLELHSKAGDIATSGCVRWVGLHPAYRGLPGVGIEFDQPEPMLSPPEGLLKQLASPDSARFKERRGGS